MKFYIRMLNNDVVADADLDVMETEDELDVADELDVTDELANGAFDDSYGMGGELGMVYNGSMDDGMLMGTDEETTVKDPILSSVPFVSITISVALVIGIVLGALLGKKRIKKGFDSYEN